MALAAAPRPGRVPRAGRWTGLWTTPSSAIIDADAATGSQRPPVTRRPARGGDALALVRVAAEAAAARKARDLVALDLRDLSGVCDYFLICSAASEVQVKAIAEAIEERLELGGTRAWHVEGREGRRWVLLDYVEFVVHVFHEKTREYYMLDRLWGDARGIDLGLEHAD
jgi:ribosome-associated protein